MQKARFGWFVSIPFFAVHVVAVVGVIVGGWSWSGLALAVALHYVKMFGVTGGFHRYFSHRTYRTSRAFQFFLAFLAMTSFQKGVLWWAAHHRGHHKFSDTPDDVHSFRDYGFWYSHVGWILDRNTEATEEARIPDLMRYPELRWLNRYHLVPGLVLAGVLYAAGGWHAALWGTFVSTVFTWHGTFIVNSLAHCFGRRRYVTTDESRNSLLISLVTMGEGWHNNHHYYPRSTRQGFFWWEVDATFYILKALSWVGLVWDLHEPNAKVRAGQLPSAIARATRNGKMPSAPTPLPEGLVPAPVLVAAESAAE